MVANPMDGSKSTLDVKDQESKIKNIFLIGYRGTGKTTVAKILAGRLSWRWIDADAAVEERYGRSIRTIFAEEGEVGFRQKESALLEELVRLQDHVVATGGGIVLNPQNRDRMRQSGKVVWLTGDAATLWQRLEDDVSTPERRPQLTVGGMAEIAELLQRREPLYRECANIIVETVGRSPEEVAVIINTELGLAANRH
jgi:shikimate kinase